MNDHDGVVRVRVLHGVLASCGGAEHVARKMVTSDEIVLLLREFTV